MGSAERRWYRPREVADLLGVPASTLRTYAANFGSLLSEDARQDSGGDRRGFRHRRYDESDLQVLRSVKELLDAGMSYRAVLTRLGGAAPRPAPRRRRPAASRTRATALAPPLPPPTPAPAPLPEPPRLATAEIDNLREEIRALRAEVVASRVPNVEPLPTIDPATIDRLGVQLQQIQVRLDQIESLLIALATPVARPGWFARLFRRERPND